MKKKYDYVCPANGQILEVEHDWSLKIENWGQLCLVLGIEMGDTPSNVRVERLLEAPTILTGRPQGRKPGPHPISCACGSCSPAQDAYKSQVMQAAKPELRKVKF